jgi:YidC/Oxa1 family membrane protein insertase
MEIFSLIWQEYLYIPTFNLLIWIYGNYSFFNLGIAVIILTIGLRLLLLPFTIMAERGKIISQRLRADLVQIDRDYINDPVKKKTVIRKFLKKKKIRPWAKTIVLGVQLMVLVLLYRVFLGGIDTAEKRHLLYPTVTTPDFINTKFLWFDIGQRDMIIAAVVAGYLFAYILINMWDRKNDVNKKEQIYTLLFPALIFLILAILPSVKSIFFLTSLVFSSIISIIVALIKFSLKGNKKKAEKSA